MIDINILNDYSGSLCYNDDIIKKISKTVLTSEKCNDGKVSIILSSKSVFDLLTIIFRKLMKILSMINALTNDMIIYIIAKRGLLSLRLFTRLLNSI